MRIVGVFWFPDLSKEFRMKMTKIKNPHDKIGNFYQLLDKN